MEPVAVILTVVGSIVVLILVLALWSESRYGKIPSQTQQTLQSVVLTDKEKQAKWEQKQLEKQRQRKQEKQYLIDSILYLSACGYWAKDIAEYYNVTKEFVRYVQDEQRKQELHEAAEKLKKQQELFNRIYGDD